jgi:hypothetical protein
MSSFKFTTKLVAVSLAAVSMACMAGVAQAQSGKPVVVAMAPADVSPVQQAKPMRTAVPAVIAPSRKHIVATAAAKPAKSDCFWCNRTVYVSGMTF